MWPAVIVNEIQGAPEEKPVSERTTPSRKYIKILDDYKTCGQLDIILWIKKFRALWYAGHKGSRGEMECFQH